MSSIRGISTVRNVFQCDLLNEYIASVFSAALDGKLLPTAAFRLAHEVDGISVMPAPWFCTHTVHENSTMFAINDSHANPLILLVQYHQKASRLVHSSPGSHANL